MFFEPCRLHGRIQFYSQSPEVSSQTGSLTADLKEEKGTVKKLKGDIQQLEEELAEAKAEREATEKVGIEVECFTLHPLPRFSILLPFFLLFPLLLFPSFFLPPFFHLNLVSLSLLFLPLSHPSSSPLVGTVGQEKEAIIIEETV